MSNIVIEKPAPSFLTVAWEAFYKNRYAALILWVFGVGLIGGFFLLESIRVPFQQIAILKSNSGFLFAAISTGIFGGLAPIIFEKLTQSNSRQSAASLLAYGLSNFLFWAIKGVEIDCWYQVQGIIWGNQPDFWTIVCKTFLDQFIYVPIFGIVNAVWFYRWREQGYRLGEKPFMPSWAWYKKYVLAILVSNWFVWVPSVAMIYCLPINLQLPIQNLILCLWVMMLALMAKEEESA